MKSDKMGSALKVNATMVRVKRKSECDDAMYTVSPQKSTVVPTYERVPRQADWRVIRLA